MIKTSMLWYEKFNIPGSIHIPLSDLQKSESLDMIDPEKAIILASKEMDQAASKGRVMLR